MRTAKRGLSCKTAKLVRLGRSRFTMLTVWLAFLLALPLVLQAQVKFSEFPIPTAGSSPQGIALGSDGAMWFAENAAGAPGIGRIDIHGKVTEYALPANSQAQEIVSGPDGNLYFTVANGNFIGQLTPAGGVTEFAIPISGASPTGITVGPMGTSGS